MRSNGTSFSVGSSLDDGWIAEVRQRPKSHLGACFFEKDIV